MLLYHGTSGAVARRAFTEGLLPRSVSGIDSLWAAHPSSPEAVYLTRAYAGYFAAAATGVGEPWGIVEVDTDRLDARCLVPDEDFLEQATQGEKIPAGRRYESLWGADITARTAWFRAHLLNYSSLWADSIRGLGNCAYLGAVSPEAITRVVVVDSRKIGDLAYMVLDPVICLMNHKFCGEKYQALTDWFIGEPVEAARVLGWSYASEYLEAAPPSMRAHMDKQLARMGEALADRSGLEIIENKKRVA